MASSSSKYGSMKTSVRKKTGGRPGKPDDRSALLFEMTESDVTSISAINSTLDDGTSYDTFDESSLRRSTVELERSRGFKSITDIGVTLSWADLDVRTTPGNRRITQNVSGVAQAGRLLAIMGASGAGKSTLLNVLTHRSDRSLDIKGKVFLNGIPLTENVKKISAYVPQHDIFLGYLTVFEHLWFNAVLRMGKEYTLEEKRMRVEQVMLELNLKKCRDSLIGFPGKMKTLSGGEMKRLAFASELVTNPSILFCDEPTTGLDSFMAEAVVQSLRGLAKNGKTVLCTIHQPSSQTFKLFDDLLLMSEGRIAYLGPLSNCLPFLEETCGHHCPSDFNPADFLIHLLAIKSTKEIESRRQANAICDAYEKSTHFQTVQTEVKKQIKQSKVARISESPRQIMFRQTLESKAYRATFLDQFKWVFWRTWKEYARTPEVFKIRWTQCFFYGIFYTLMYLNQDNDQIGVFNINGLIFELVALMIWENISAVIYILPLEMPVIRRDYQTGIYNFSTYFMSRAIIELPFIAANTLTEVILIYWLVGMPNDFGTFCIFLIILFLTGICSKSVGYLLSCTTDNLSILATAIPAIVYPVSYVAGLYINIGSIPVYLKWFQYISFYYYSMSAIMINQWKEIGPLRCDTSNMSPCYTDGPDVLKRYGYTTSELSWDIAALFVIYVVLRLLAYTITVVKLKRSSQ